MRVFPSPSSRGVVHRASRRGWRRNRWPRQCPTLLFRVPISSRCRPSCPLRFPFWVCRTAGSARGPPAVGAVGSAARAGAGRPEPVPSASLHSHELAMRCGGTGEREAVARCHLRPGTWKKRHFPDCSVRSAGRLDPYRDDDVGRRIQAPQLRTIRPLAGTWNSMWSEVVSMARRLSPPAVVSTHLGSLARFRRMTRSRATQVSPPSSVIESTRSPVRSLARRKWSQKRRNGAAST